MSLRSVAFFPAHGLRVLASVTQESSQASASSEREATAAMPVHVNLLDGGPHGLRAGSMPDALGSDRRSAIPHTRSTLTGFRRERRHDHDPSKAGHSPTPSTITSGRRHPATRTVQAWLRLQQGPPRLGRLRTPPQSRALCRGPRTSYRNLTPPQIRSATPIGRTTRRSRSPGGSAIHQGTATGQPPRRRGACRWSRAQRHSRRGHRVAAGRRRSRSSPAGRRADPQRQRKHFEVERGLFFDALAFAAVASGEEVDGWSGADAGRFASIAATGGGWCPSCVLETG